MHIYKFKIFFTIAVLIILSFFLSAQKAFAQDILFQDNFDDGNAVGWLIFGSPGWNVLNNKYGIFLNNGLSNSVPSDTLWDYSWTNISYELDLIGLQGVDKNILIKYKDSSNFIEFHANDNGIFLEKASSVGGAAMLGTSNQLLSNNINYHFRFEIRNNEHIKVYMNGVPMFDVNETTPLITNWKVGLRVGTGSTPIADVWYDNVVVSGLDDTSTPTPTLTPSPTATLTPTLTPTPTPPTPVVFLPGLGASFNFPEMFLGISNPDGWIMTPGAKVYDNIIKAFENYPNFYVFNYNWKKSALESADDLNTFIKNKVKPWDKVFFVGHSLGGLVARTCIQKTENACFAGRLITFGTPHRGAVQIYPVVEAGEVWGSNIVDIFMKILIHYHQRPFETPRETALRIAPISLELLPTFDFLKRNDVFIPWTSLSVVNPLLPQLDVDTTPLNDITTTLFGYGFPTYDNIEVTDRSFWDKLLGNWADGKPVNKYYRNGDGTVLIESALINSPFIDKPFLNFDHSQIISDKLGVQKVFELLKIPFPDINLEEARDEKDYLIFFAHSPVELSSPDTNSESFINPEMIIIPHPENKNYTLKIKGTSNGKYALSVGQIYGENTQWFDFFNSITTGEIQNFVFAINPQISPIPPTPLIDPKGINTKNFANSIIDELKLAINNLSLDKDRKNLLLASVVLIKVSKPEESLTPLGLFRKTVSLYENAALISTERANFFRSKSSQLAGFLETLAFLAPKITKVNIAQSSLSSALKSKNSVKINNLTKNSGLVYLEAEEKYKKAVDAFAKKDYYKTKIFALESSSLYSESKSIK